VGTLYITVHGTGDGDFAAVGEEPKWWEAASPFCRELLANAPRESSVEPFVWSGANDEMQRRQAAEALYRKLRSAETERVVLVGHSHGGSVIVTALHLAAARRDTLPKLERWVTIGTPFIQMRRRVFPWERYSLFGQTLLSFAVLLALVAAVAALGQTFFWQAAVVAGIIGVALCLALLRLTQRTARLLRSKRVAQHFENAFKPRWLGLASSHDEATNGLARLPVVKLTLFDWTLVAPVVRTLASAAFIAVAGVAWLTFGGADTSFAPAFFEITTDVQQRLTWGFLQWIGSVFDYFFDEPTDLLNYSMVALWAVLAIAIYLAVLWVLLRLTDLVVRMTVGLAVASGLNRSVNEMILKRAYGNTTTGEFAYAARTTPFSNGPDVERLPEDVNGTLLAFARMHAGETLARLHDTLFQEGDVSDEALVKSILERISWRELIHTAYFRVEETRRYLASRIATPVAPVA
jgi:hypothetical protein